MTKEDQTIDTSISVGDHFKTPTRGGMYTVLGIHVDTDGRTKVELRDCRESGSCKITMLPASLIQTEIREGDAVRISQ